MATWHSRVRQWIDASKPEHLLAIDIFFDLRPVHGDGALGAQLRRDAFGLAQGQIPFIKLLAEGSAVPEPGLNMLGRFKAKEGRIDLKKTGLFGIVGAARVLAVAHHVLDRSTKDRLGGLQAIGRVGERVAEALAGAHEVFLDLILRQQIADLEHGHRPSNRVEIKGLSGDERDRLRRALQAVEHIDQLMRDAVFPR